VIARANEAGLNLTTQDVYRFQTVAEQAAAAASAKALTAEQGRVTGEVPLTPIQHWFFEGDIPEPHHFNWATFLPKPPGLSADDLRRALEIILGHHDALRLRFVQSESGVWKQSLSESDEELPLSLVDLSDVLPERQRDAIETRAAELQTSLDLANGPLLRLTSFDLGPGRPGYLLLIVHHLVIDAVSWATLLADLTTLLRQLRTGHPARPPAKTSSFKQWAERLVEHARSGIPESERGYWLDELRLDVAPLPRDYPDGVNSRDSGRQVTVDCGERETRGLLNMAIAAQIGADEILVATLALALARWTGRCRVLINVERHGRDDLGAGLNLSRTVGWFASVAPVLLEVPEQAPPAEVLQVALEQLRVIPGRGLGYGLYLGDEEMKRRLKEQSRAEVFFNYLGQQRERAGSKARGPAAQQPDVGPRMSKQVCVAM